MINHAPVMLLNKPMSYFTGQSEAIYIPESFTPVTLNSSLTKIRRVLFPDGITPTTELAILYKLLPIIHMPELQDYIDVWDVRRTYEVSAVDREQFVMTPVTIKSSQSAACDMTARYRWAASTAIVETKDAGDFTWSFRDGTALQSVLTNSRGKSELVTMVDGSVANKSLEIALMPGRLFAYFDLPTTATLTGSYKFEYRASIDPTYDLRGVIDRLEHLLYDQAISRDLFNSFDPMAANMGALQYTWQASSEMLLRFGAALMAYTYQVTNLTLQNGQYSV